MLMERVHVEAADTAAGVDVDREALRAIGFEEDRGACAVMECAGCFKYQHDTDKDLKFIHVLMPPMCENDHDTNDRSVDGSMMTPPWAVERFCPLPMLTAIVMVHPHHVATPQVFPKIDTAAAAAAAAPAGDEDEAEIKVAGMSLDELPPEHLCAIVSCETFSKLYSKQCTSFSQRRALLKALKELAARLIGFEERMTNMQPLTAAEEELYNTAQDVPEKVGVAQSVAVRVRVRVRRRLLCVCLSAVCMSAWAWHACGLACMSEPEQAPHIHPLARVIPSSTPRRTPHPRPPYTRTRPPYTYPRRLRSLRSR